MKKEIAQAVQKPIRVKIPNTLFSPDDEGEEHSICLFCRTEDKESLEAYLESHPIDGLAKVISLTEAKKHYKQFKDKKSLLSSHTHFLCDERIFQHLYNFLGVTFSARDNRPLPIHFANLGQLSAAVAKAVNSAHFRKAGRLISIRLGHTALTPAAVTENILEGVPFAVEKLKNNWKDVHSVHVKTADSASLPVYSRSSNEMTEYVAKQVQPYTATTSSASAVKKKRKASDTTTTTTTAAAVEDHSRATPGRKKRAVEVAEEVAVAAPAKELSAATTPASVVALKKSTKKGATTATAISPTTDKKVKRKASKAVAAPSTASKAGSGKSTGGGPGAAAKAQKRKSIA